MLREILFSVIPSSLHIADMLMLEAKTQPKLDFTFMKSSRNAEKKNVEFSHSIENVIKR